MKKENAFTLIEMLVVLVIIGIIIGMAVPVMTSLTRSTGLQGGLRQVSNMASLARQFAITHRVRTTIKVETNTFTAIAAFTNGIPNDIQIGKWEYLPIGVIIDTNSALGVTFKPTGGTTDNANKAIIVREGIYDTNSLTMLATNSNLGTITIDGLLGRVSVTRP